MNAMNTEAIEAPWYRQFWPWLLIALPASAVIGCAITIWLVLKNPEHEVPRDAAATPVNEVLGRNSVVPPKE
jgi:hypothetical protein